jgi:hypothetical protein
MSIVLIAAAFFLAAGVLWLRPGWRRSRAWEEFCNQAALAVHRGDFALAHQQLDQAEALVDQSAGFLRQIRAQATQSLRTLLHYRAGQLDRCATMAFDQLQQHQSGTVG